MNSGYVGRVYENGFSEGESLVVDCHLTPDDPSKYFYCMYILYRDQVYLRQLHVMPSCPLQAKRCQVRCPHNILPRAKQVYKVSWILFSSPSKRPGTLFLSHLIPICVWQSIVADYLLDIPSLHGGYVRGVRQIPAQ
jgi:hypothetical protein